MLQDVRSSTSQSLNPGQHYLLKIVDIGLHVESEAIWEHEWSHNITITIDHSEHNDVDWVLGFNPYQYILWGLIKSTVVCEFTI